MLFLSRFIFIKSHSVEDSRVVQILWLKDAIRSTKAQVKRGRSIKQTEVLVTGTLQSPEKHLTPFLIVVYYYYYYSVFNRSRDENQYILRLKWAELRHASYAKDTSVSAQ